MQPTPPRPSDDAHPPALRYRGVIEGFYGPMWTHADRLHLLEHMPAWGMNLYIYSPRNDPYHRFHWDAAYPAHLMARMHELAAAAQRSGVQFAYAVSPGNTFDPDSPSHRGKLVDKLRPFIDMGCTFFPIFYDDLCEGFDADSEVGVRHAQLQARVMNDIAADVTSLCPEAAFLFCPTQYMTADKSAYLCRLHELLDPRIETVVTGVDADTDTVCPRTFSDAGAQRYHANFGRRPFLWDNFNVRDNAVNVLHWSPYRGRGENLHTICSGIVLNPQNVYLLNLPIFGCMGDYFANPHAYDPAASFERHVTALMGEAGAPLGMTLSKWFTAEWFARAGDGFLSSEANLPTIPEAIGSNRACAKLLHDVRAALAPLCDFNDRFVRTLMEPEVAAALVGYANVLSDFARAMVAFCDEMQAGPDALAEAAPRLLAATDRPYTECFRLPVSLLEYPGQLTHALMAAQRDGYWRENG